MTADRPLLVVAVGGNALLRRGEPPDTATARDRLAGAARHLASLGRGHRLVITHGNGPQVGVLAAQDAATPAGTPTPLDVLDAETEGGIGYLLAEAIGAETGDERVVVLLTRVVVDPSDAAFTRPDKPVGPVLPEAEARALSARYGWAIAPDAGGWRRVVPSPSPRRLVEIDAIRSLVASGVTVVCAGGGGIPVSSRRGALVGVEAVVDKDRTSALLAEQLGADSFLVLTDVDAVLDGWGTPDERPLRRVSVPFLLGRSWAPGSMAPKVEAVCSFVAGTGRPARIGALEQAEAVLADEAGTLVLPG
ncbi:MAG: carbamate kinase [Acidimicrobiales bacterium]|jgi:carbamate kinase|nr:carbamate kinase [Acidimicrobiales bacterium]